MTDLNHGYHCFLFALHEQGMESSKAYYELLKVTGSEVLSLKQVQEYFEKMTAGEFTMKVEQSDVRKPNFSQLLAASPICEALIAHCGVGERLALRAVSHAFKDLVDDSLLKLQTLSIGNDGNTGFIRADNFELRYNKVPNGYVLSNGFRAILKKNVECFMYHQQIHLKTILRLPKLEIDELRIHRNGENELDANTAALLLHEAAKKHGELLKVRQLQFCHPDILPCFDPKYLKVFELIDSGACEIFNLEEFAQLEQWKNLKEVITRLIFWTKNAVADLGHLDYMDLLIDGYTKITSDDLVALKDKFLLRPTFQKFEIMPTRNYTRRESIFLTAPPSFKPFQDLKNQEWYHFKYPNSNERLSVRIHRDGILFKGPCYLGNKIRIPDRREADGNNDDSEDDD